MKNLQKIHWAYFTAGLLGVFFLDFITKWLAVKGVIGESVIVRGLFYMTHFQKNNGIAYGIPLPLWIQVIGSIIILFLLVRFGFDCITDNRKPSVFRIVLLGIIVGSGLGNLVDRIVNGYVVDFIVLRPFPVFNVADVGITVGIILLFGTIVLSSEKCETKNKKPKD